MQRARFRRHGRDLLRCLRVLLLVLLAPAAVRAQDLAITNVTTIDPASGEVRDGQTVLIDDGTIRSVTDGMPHGAHPAASIDASGRFLIPGLWDMHVHLDGHTDTDLTMLVANGVLSVRDMGGDPFAMADRRERIASGEIVGPTIRYAGSILEDRVWLERARKSLPSLEHRLPVDNPEEARASVAMLASWGVDLIKTRNVHDRASLAAILRAAAEHGLTVAGHEPMVVELDEAARLGMTSFEHVPFLSLTMPGKQVDETRLEEVTTALRESGAFLDPTLIASNTLGASREERAAMIDRPDERYRYLPDSVKAQWLESLEDDPGPLPWAAMRERSLEMLKQMHAAGVPLLAGTDMGVPLTFPGFSLHDELGLLVEQLGITPLEALRAATSNPARLFGIDGGAIAPGMPADLVLLRANPLTDITNTGTIEAVVLRGELLDRAELDRLLAFVRETKDREPESTPYERLETSCRADETAECLERLAGYRFSRFLYADARATYEEALARGAGDSALEGLFGSTINLLHAGEIDCAAAAETTDRLLARHPGEPNKIVGVLDRLLPPLEARCSDETPTYLSRLAAVDESSLDDEMRPIYREHYASYLAHVEGDEEAAYAYRVESLPDSWREDSTSLEEVATWCLEQGVALDKGRELAQLAQQHAASDYDRLTAMMLEARIASAAGDHAAAVALMEALDRAVPNNETITGLLETYRELAAADDASSSG